MDKLKNNGLLKLIFIALIIAIVLLLAYSGIGIRVGGDKSILISDMYNQYIDFLGKYRDMLVKGQLPLYSMSTTLGANIIGWFAYYVASPLNIILVFFNEENFLNGVLILTVLKITLSGITFAIYLMKGFKDFTNRIILFAVCYALMSYNIVYSFNIMWLDGVIILPLVLLGIHKIIEKDDVRLLTISLIYAFISNYYISYMVGVFSFIYFVLFLSIKIYKRDWYGKIIKFFFATLIAAGTCAVLLIPVYFDLTQGNGIAELGKFIPYALYDFYDLGNSMIIGMLDTVRGGSLPKIYCGTIMTLLAALFFFNKEINFKERILSFIVLIGLLVSTNISTLNLIWHAFEEPSWFNHRYSFIISAFIIVLGYREIKNINGTSVVHILSVLAISVLYIIVGQKFDYSYLSDFNLLVTLIFILMNAIMLILLVKSNTKSTVCIVLIFVITIVELGFNTYIIFNKLDQQEGYSSSSIYYDNINILDELLSDLGVDEDAGYRTEKNFGRSLNDSMTIGFNGLTHFSSATNQNLNQFIQRLGVKHEYNATYYKGNTLFVDSLFGIRYLILENQNKNYLMPIKGKDNKIVYENPYVFPLGFVATKSVTEDIKGETAIEVQNNIFNKLNNSPDDRQVLFKEVELFQESSDIDTIKIQFELEASVDPIYIYILANNPEMINIYVNDVELENEYTLTEIPLEYLKDTNEIIIKNRGQVVNQIQLYSLDISTLRKFTETVNNRQMDILDKREGYIKGIFTTDQVNNTLFTSIPYDENWRIKIDNKPVKAQRALGGLLSIELEDVGEHTVEMKYIPKGLYLGTIITFISILLYIIYLLKFRKPKEMR